MENQGIKFPSLKNRIFLLRR